MIAAAVVMTIAFGYTLAILMAVCKSRWRFTIGVLALVLNYGVRRLIFLDPVASESQWLWLSLTLFGDLTLIVLLLVSVAARGYRIPLRAADKAVLVLFAFTVILALGDPRGPVLTKTAYWKSHYFYILAFFLARWNSPPERTARITLYAVAVVAVADGLRQFFFGLNLIELGWIDSGFSILANSTEQVTGAHYLGDLSAGFVRVFSFFSGPTAYGTFLVFTLSIWMRESFAEHPVTGPRLMRALCHPFVLTLLMGLLITLQRRSWFVLLMYLTLFAVLSTPKQSIRWKRLLTAATLLATLLACFLLVATELRGVKGPVGRIFITGTYTGGRLTYWSEFLEKVAANPHLLLTGDGIGSNSAAASKFGVSIGSRRILHHNYLFTMVEDGGVILAALWFLPLVITGRSLRSASTQPFVSSEVAYTSAVLMAAVLVGGFLSNSVELTLYWSGIGIALNGGRRELEATRSM
jgi:hypothetical protein